jgi:hypothetical protein
LADAPLSPFQDLINSITAFDLSKHDPTVLIGGAIRHLVLLPDESVQIHLLPRPEAAADTKEEGHGKREKSNKEASEQSPATGPPDEAEKIKTD